MTDDILDRAGRLLAAAAPTVAGLIGGPLAGQGVQLTEQTLGLTPGADQKAALTAVIGASPDQLIALNKAGLELQEKLTDAGIQLEIADAGDRASARTREAKLGDLTPTLLALGVTLGFFGLLGFLTTHEVPGGSRDLLNTMLGALGAAWTSVVAYYFGSSAGHAEATALLGAAAARATPSRS